MSLGYQIKLAFIKLNSLVFDYYLKFFFLLFLYDRYEDQNNIIRKRILPPVPAYENWIESQTIQDLQAIRLNHNSMHMESLTIRERILGRKCPDVAHPIVFRLVSCFFLF